MYTYNKSLPPKQLGVQHQNYKKIGENKGHNKGSAMSFLSPRYLNTWSYEGLVADS